MGIEQLYAMKPAMDAIMEPFLKKQNLQFDLAELEDKLDLEKDPIKIKMYEESIQGLKLEISEIDMTPAEAFRDGLKESVEQLEKINPPLAKFLETLGNFTLNFVGEEGAENRGKVAKVGETALKVYSVKKFFDVLFWFNKNYKDYKDVFKDGKSGDISDTLTKTLKTMNVTASVVNVNGDTGGISPTPNGKGTSGSPVPLPDPNSSNGKTSTSPKSPTLAPMALTSIIPSVDYVIELNERNGFSQEQFVSHVKKRLAEREKEKEAILKRKIDELTNYQNEIMAVDNAIKLGEKTPSKKEVKTSKDIEVVQDSSKYIKEINTSILSFSETMNKLANIQPEQVRQGPLKERGNDFILKELNRITEIDNKINLQNDVKVAAPTVSVSVNIDGKNIPARVEMKSSGSDMNFLRTMEILARRTGSVK